MDWYRRHSLVARGMMPRFAAGLALFFTIPLLVAVYVFSSGMLAAFDQNLLPLMVIGLVVAVMAAAGFLLLRQGPREVVRLRGQLEKVVADELCGEAAAVPEELASDVEAIYVCMRSIVRELQARVARLEGERSAMLRELMMAHKVEGMGTMAAGIAHDYNNLMAAIMGNMSIVLHAMPLDSPVRDNALQIERTAVKIVEMNSRMAVYSGHCRIDISPVNLSNLVREERNALEALASRNITVDLRLDAALPLIHADRARLEQVLTNLVANAVEALVDRSGAITVTTGQVACDAACLAQSVLKEKLSEGRYVYLDVADTGCGVSEDVRLRMFDPFFSTKLRGQGMGLAVVLGVVRAHQGAILVDSAPGKGSVFRIILPCPETVRRRS